MYATWLELCHPDQIAADLAADGYGYVVIGDDTEERELGSPYVYRGSHVVPADGDPRGGSLGVAAIPNHCHPDADRSPDRDEDDVSHRVDFLRLDLTEDPTTYRYEWHNGDATVVLDRRQVTVLRDTLNRWLDSEVRW